MSVSSSDVHAYQSSTESGQTDQMPTSPLLFHPVPTRPVLLQLLSSHSFDSDDAESTVAQVGVQRPHVPPSQVEENEAWRTFVANSDGTQDSTSLPTHDEEVALERRVSSGVSQRGEEEPTRDTDRKEAPTHAPASEDIAICAGMEVVPPENTLAHLQSGQFDIVGSDPLLDGQVAPASGESSPERPNNCLAHTHKDHTGGTKTQDIGHVPSESSDEVLLLEIPSSPNISPSTSNMSSHETLLHMPQPEEINQGATTRTLQSTEYQNSRDLSRAQSTPHIVPKPTHGAPEDENDLWRKFVFGNPDENLEQAFEDARKETARNLRPSITSSSTCDDVSGADLHQYGGFHQPSTSPSSGLCFKVDKHIVSENAEHFPTIISTTAPASHIATAGGSSPVLTSEFSDLETTTQTDQAVAGTSSSSLEQADLTEGPRLPTFIETSLAESDKLPPKSRSNQVEGYDEANEGFRFARPKLFMGKKLGPVDEQRQIALSAAQIRGRNQTRRRATKTNDGRANIRKLPNYGSDPIEEFEEDIQSDRAQQGSIFGSLETDETS